MCWRDFGRVTHSASFHYSLHRELAWVTYLVDSLISWNSPFWAFSASNCIIALHSKYIAAWAWCWVNNFIFLLINKKNTHCSCNCGCTILSLLTSVVIITIISNYSRASLGSSTCPLHFAVHCRKLWVHYNRVQRSSLCIRCRQNMGGVFPY